MKLRIVAYIFIASAMAWGCASAPRQEKNPPFDEGLLACPEGKANVFFIRVDKDFRRQFPVDVHIDNKKMASLQQNDFTRLILEPGNHIINLYGHDGTLLYPCKLQANKNYYYQVDETQRGTKAEPSIGILVLEFDAKMRLKNAREVKAMQ